MKYLLAVAALLILFGSDVSFSYAQGSTASFRVETVASNLAVPWSMDFTPNGDIIFTERNGNVKLLQRGEDEPVTIGRIDVASTGEAGLLGIVLHPDFENNHYVYLYYTYVGFVFPNNRVSRFTLENNALANEQIIVDNIPGAPVHDGGRIAFGPDGKLYVTTGDAANSGLAQDISSLAGKILRLNPDGSIPEDNPFNGSPVYSYGHRNPQGIDWDPRTGRLVATEHGPSGEKGFAHDEVNVVEPGKNYGWPNIVGSADEEEYVDPILHTGDVTWAPAGASFYDGNKFPEWKNHFFIANLRGSHLHMLEMDLEQNKVILSEPLLQNAYGRLRDVVQGPDDFIYVLTSNRDGRGTPAPNDDRMIRLVPLFDTYEFRLNVKGFEFPVTVSSDISISSLDLDKELKQLTVSLDAGSSGFANLTFAKTLLGGPYNAAVDQESVSFESSQNSTHTSVYVELPEGATKIDINGATVIPEFPYWQIVFITGTALLFLFRFSILSELKFKTR